MVLRSVGGVTLLDLKRSEDICTQSEIHKMTDKIEQAKENYEDKDSFPKVY